MSVSNDLIARGYFPQEAPPTFTTTSLAAFVQATGLSTLNSTHQTTHPNHLLRHNIARVGGFRRQLSIPNPIDHMAISEVVDTHWSNEMAPNLSPWQFASSCPRYPAIGRALAPRNIDSVSERARSRRAGRVLLRTDIQNFYPSIYSHSIPWAIHGKQAAKMQRRNMNLVGNKLDLCVRNAQDGQTLGVPVGPDTSWLIAELLMAKVEVGLQAKIGPLQGHRYLDDWELCFRSAGDAERALSNLQEVLSEFELSLNPRKTEIVGLPDPLEDTGIHELRRWNFSTTSVGQRRDLIAYFDRVSKLLAACRTSNIASYAVARLRSATLSVMATEVLVHQLINLFVTEPACAKQVATTISLLVQGGHIVDRTLIATASEEVVLRHAPLGHGSEVAWALWLCIAHSVPLSQEVADSVVGMVDDLVALLTLHAAHLGLIPQPLNAHSWAQLMTVDELRGPHWLLSYEARVKGWLPSWGGGDHITQDGYFAALRTGGVEFYDVNQLLLRPLSTAYVGLGAGGGGGGPYSLGGR